MTLDQLIPLLSALTRLWPVAGLLAGAGLVIAGHVGRHPTFLVAGALLTGVSVGAIMSVY